MFRKLTQAEWDQVWADVQNANAQIAKACQTQDAVALYKANDILDVATVKLRKHYAALEVERCGKA